MEDLRVGPGQRESLGEIIVENKTSNSIMVRYDKQKNSLVLVDCCLEEQGK